MRLTIFSLVFYFAPSLVGWQTEAPIVNWTRPVYFQPADAGMAKSSERAAASSPLVLVATTPCRVADSRTTMTFPFGAPMIQAGETRTYPIPQSACSIPPSARAYSLNFTVDMTGLDGLPFLTAWPTGDPRPLASVMNAPNPSVQYLANSAVIAAGQGGAISVFASSSVQLIVDINGYYIEDTSTLAAAIYHDVFGPPTQSVPAGGGVVRIAPATRILDTDNAVSTESGWTFRAPRSCIYLVSATVRNSLALIGSHTLALMAQPVGQAPVSVASQIQHTSQPGVPASIELVTMLDLRTGGVLWLEYSTGGTQQGFCRVLLFNACAVLSDRRDTE